MGVTASAAASGDGTKGNPFVVTTYEDLKENPEFLEAYVYLLREAGDATKAREVANQYLAIVPDDVQMQTLYDSL